MLVCFLTKDRKDVEPDGRGSREELGKGNHNQNILYEKKYFFNKRKKINVIIFQLQPKE